MRENIDDVLLEKLKAMKVNAVDTILLLCDHVVVF